MGGQAEPLPKSNAITALPVLLQQVARAGCLVTIAAMGCQRSIAQQIVHQQGTSVLALKGTQGSLPADGQDSCAQAQASQCADLAHDPAATVATGHGRPERRQHWVLTDAAPPAGPQAQQHWPGLAAVGLVASERRVGATATREERYYLLSAARSATAFGAAVRSPWGSEHAVPWVLAVPFGEERSRMRQGHAAEHVAVLRHLALNLLPRHPTRSTARIKPRRFQVATQEAYLFRVLAEL